MYKYHTNNSIVSCKANKHLASSSSQRVNGFPIANCKKINISKVKKLVTFLHSPNSGMIKNKWDSASYFCIKLLVGQSSFHDRSVEKNYD